MARTQKTVQPPRAFVLACATTDQGQFYNYAVQSLTLKQARNLLSLRKLWRDVHKKQQQLYGIDIFDYLVEYGPAIAGAEDVETRTDGACRAAWQRLVLANGAPFPDNARIFSGTQYPTCADSLTLTGDGIIWSASPKHSEGRFETPVLLWKQLEAVARGRNPFDTVEMQPEDLIVPEEEHGAQTPAPQDPV